jgi:glucose/arabinose dehydrogenase
MRMKLVAVGVSVITGAWLVHVAAQQPARQSGQARPAVGPKVDANKLLAGSAAFIDYRAIKPGTFRKITPADLPRPFATESARNVPTVSPRPDNAWPQTLPGFKVDLFASGLDVPRQLRLAPNGDVFVVESRPGQIRVFRGLGADGKPQQNSVFATGLKQPFGISFYPAADPQWVYVGNTNSVVRFPYKTGDLKATGAAQVIVDKIPEGGGHWTRDVVFSRDGSAMFVAVGSASNVDDPDTTPAEFRRANILQYTPEGKFVKVYASGIRNPVGLTVNSETGQLWTAVNERDALGDNLVPDYVTSVREGAFYGWPWYYIGGNQDPRHEGKRPELRSTVTVPDVLLPPHNASLGIAFNEGKEFPEEFRGDLFVGQHGSWNRAQRTGYEVVRVPIVKGRANGEFQDFLTGFVTPDGKVWGRPVAIAFATDGSMLVTDDGSNSIWRVSYPGK